MAYIGRPLNAGNLAVQSGTGDGSDTTPIATLDYSVGSSNSIAVYLDGVRQLAGTDFTAAGTTLTFTTAPANGVGIDVYFLGLELSIPTPADATVAKAKITTTLIHEHVDTTITASDSLLFADATDSNANKKDTVQGILDLVPAHTGNVAFPATQVASTDSNTIDDYEEGIWTPVLKYNNANVGMSNTSGVGRYTKIGDHVSFEYYFAVGSSAGSSTGNAAIHGLPFTSSTAPVTLQCIGVWYMANGDSVTGGLVSRIAPGATKVDLWYTNVGDAYAVNHSMADADASIHGAGQFWVDNT